MKFKPYGLHRDQPHAKELTKFERLNLQKGAPAFGYFRK